MSRIARTRTQPAAAKRSRAVLVWVVYILGILAALILIASALFTAGGYFGSDDAAVDVSPVAIVVWGGLVVLAGAIWLWRRLGGRR
ncbi:hypothetical protein BH18ACT13_BH18ACT13_02170 [soil metagenome]